MTAAIRIGIVGWGTAGRLMSEAVRQHDAFTLAGVADLDKQACDAALSAGASTYSDLASLVAAEKPDAVYVATPTPHHGEAIGTAAAVGVAVVCEKPLAATWEDAVAACEAAEAAGSILLVGNTHSYDAPVRELRRIVVSGHLGDLVSVQSSVFTDWRSRPRRPEDLAADQGGGIVLRQGAHHIDIARVVCGGNLRAVNAMTFGGRDGTETGYSALLDFESNAHAGLHYGGAGGFDSAWLTQGVGELGSPGRAPDPVSKQYFRFPCTPVNAAPTFGLTVATFTHGEALLTSRGVVAYPADGVKEYLVDGQASGWQAVLDELARALAGDPVIHTGRWGLATLEASLAIHRSAREGGPVFLDHQVPVPAGQ
jgi:phthalate 4,5-cis-dihydrodiol dehydrogenase